jgi:ABC-type nickel/cobalt efflux system permease component RcnA
MLSPIGNAVLAIILIYVVPFLFKVAVALVMSLPTVITNGICLAFGLWMVVSCIKQLARDMAASNDR